MTVEEIKAFIVSIDPDAQHYNSVVRSDNYTAWSEYELSDFMADNAHEGGYRFQIDRFTKSESDPMVKQIMDALENADYIAFSYTVLQEPDTGYIHHIFDCEGA